ncbi:MAG: phosphatidate cytidylyltransferase [Spirochaetota bacterium]
MKRILPAIILLPIFLVAMFHDMFLPLLHIGTIGISMIGIYELFVMADLVKREPVTLIITELYLVAAYIVVRSGWVMLDTGMHLSLGNMSLDIIKSGTFSEAIRKPEMAVIGGLVAILFLVNIFRSKYDRATGLAIVMAVFASIYAGFFVWQMTALRMLEHGKYYLVLPIAIVWIADAVAYYFGSRFGKHKLKDSVSPNKSIEGLIAAFVITTAIIFGLNKLVQLGALTFAFGERYAFSDVKIILVSLLFVFVGFIGDMGESLIKRAFAAKDSGNIIPGHGGVLDRFDSVIFSLPVMYYLIVWRIL